MSNTTNHLLTGFKPSRLFTALIVAFNLLWPAGPSRAAERGPLPITPDTLSAVLNTDSYGYDITCIINGHNVGIVGGKSESLRQFDEKTHEESTTPHDRNNYSTLHLGRNTVRITYHRRNSQGAVRP